MTAILIWVSINRITIDTDIVAGLPKDDGILAQAAYIFKNHPIQDQIAIDIGLDRVNRNLSIHVAAEVEGLLQQSGMFTKVGMDDMQQLIPSMINDIVDHLPLLFSLEELENHVQPLLSPNSIDSRVRQIHKSLIGMDGVGQAYFITRDPLGLKNLKIAALSNLAPSQNAQIYKGKIFSMDAKHLLVLAHPKISGTNTAAARKLTSLINTIQTSLKKKFPDIDNKITITPIGAYRSALDNEQMVRRDVNMAIGLATLGIAILLLLGFPRPLFGLMALLPAIVGMATAFYIFSLINNSVSILTIGFGGAIISITVDHGIAYLLFLDRPHETFGKETSKEIWAIGLLAVLTTSGAFSALGFCGFPIFEELGLFTAMGIAFSFLFVHTVFPIIFPAVPPAIIKRQLPLQILADRLFANGSKGLAVAILAVVFFAFLAKPNFDVDLRKMNSVSDSTASAEQLFSRVWGNMFSKVFIMTEAGSLADLQNKSDLLLNKLERARENDEITSFFASSQLFPSPYRAQSNFADWRSFWTHTRVEKLRSQLTASARRYGFIDSAFDPFINSLPATAAPNSVAIDPKYFELLSISVKNNENIWRQFSSVTPGPRYNGKQFFQNFSLHAKIFDANLFSDKMGELIFSTFMRMLLIIGVCVVLLLLLFFADWRLTLISLLPIVFAFTCTLGTLKLMGRGLDIPAIMLAIIVLGMGVDYTLYLVRSYQRYHDNKHPYLRLIRISVLMTSISTLIGFGVLCTAQHNVLQSVGITSFLAIAYSMIGACLILPPILGKLFDPSSMNSWQHSEAATAVRSQYRNMEPYPRFFARFKLKLDPMFDEMRAFLPPTNQQTKRIIDIGTGYGVPACWLAHRYPNAFISGIEPKESCVRVASIALGDRGTIVSGHAPQLPPVSGRANIACMLDMCHFLDDNEFKLLLQRLHQTIDSEGILVTRVVLKPQRRFPWVFWIENAKTKIHGQPQYYRTMNAIAELMRSHHFAIVHRAYSGTREDLAWIIARRCTVTV